jgi:DNA-binding NarL/FixJ family response regulator
VIRISILDSYAIFADGLVQVLTREGFAVTAVASSLEDFEWQAELFIVDPQAVPDTLLDAFIASTARKAPVLLLAPAEPGPVTQRCLRAGATGYVARSTSPDVVVTAARVVANGGRFPSAGTAPAADADPLAGTDPSAGTDTDEATSLSPREIQVLGQLALGLTHSQIARNIGISQHTVDTYVKRIRSKLELGNKAELTRAAVHAGYDRLPMTRRRRSGLGVKEAGSP